MFRGRITVDSAIDGGRINSDPRDSPRDRDGTGRDGAEGDGIVEAARITSPVSRVSSSELRPRWDTVERGFIGRY